MQDIRQRVQAIEAIMQAFRRDIHTHPELAWTEYRTASKIAEIFLQQDCTLIMGAEATNAADRLDNNELAKNEARHKARAIIQGAQPSLVERMGTGLTGLWVDIALGTNPNPKSQTPILAFRFDMDAVSVQESSTPEHKPQKEGFSSQNKGLMHACGHDGHVAMGVGLGLALCQLKKDLGATIKQPCIVRLIFQPAEEVAQGAKAMVKAGAAHQVSEIYGIHLGVQAQGTGTLIGGTTHFLANTTFEVTFSGKAAHSGLAPEEGRNALLAATAAVQGMHSIARHGKGLTRINIGHMEAKGAPNVVPERAFMVGETRAEKAHINAWMTEEAQRICQGAAHMWACHMDFRVVGTCVSGLSNTCLAQEVCTIAGNMPCFDNILPSAKFLASEDFTWFLEAVQSQGGRGTYIQLGTKLCAGHHASAFDFDETSLSRGVELMLRIIISKTGQ